MLLWGFTNWITWQVCLFYFLTFFRFLVQFLYKAIFESIRFHSLNKTFSWISYFKRNRRFQKKFLYSWWYRIPADYRTWYTGNSREIIAQLKYLLFLELCCRLVLQHQIIGRLKEKRLKQNSDLEAHTSTVQYRSWYPCCPFQLRSRNTIRQKKSVKALFNYHIL